MKIKKRHLRQILNGSLTLEDARLRGYLLEASPTPDASEFSQSEPQMYENVSVDLQIDKFIMQADAGESNEPQAPQRESFLREAGDEETPSQQPTKQMSDKISFVTEVAQLVEKSDTLLDIKGTIVRRALNYVTKNYDAKQAKDIERMLDANFDIQADPSADSYDEIIPPAAAGAGPTGG